MNISELSIRRPVLATVLTIIILLFGFIGYSYLGVREYHRWTTRSFLSVVLIRGPMPT